MSTLLHYISSSATCVSLQERPSEQRPRVAPPVVKKAADAAGFIERTPQRKETGLSEPNHKVIEKSERCQVCATERCAEGSINQIRNVWTT